MGNRRPPYERPEPPPDPRRRLCMVRAQPGRSECPGLILEWRETNAGLWAARVSYVPDPRKTESREDWFARSLVRVIDPPAVSQANRAAARYSAAGGSVH